MRCCLIITAYLEGNFPPHITEKPYDFVICADAGYLIAERNGIAPDLIIGDFDSAKFPENNTKNVMRVPVEKDDTDTLLCIKKAIELGFRELVILGGIGGRLDHTYSNIQALAYAARQNIHAVLCDAHNEVQILFPGNYRFPKFDGAFSVFAYSAEVRGLTERGVYYPLTNGKIDQFFPIGISNKIIDESAEISFTEGILLLIFSKED